MTPKQVAQITKAFNGLTSSEVFMVALGVVTQACVEDATTVVRPAVDSIKHREPEFDRLLAAIDVLKMMTQ